MKEGLVVNKMRMIFSGMFAAVIFAVATATSVFAAAGTTVGGGGQNGCAKEGWTLDTCYGATWKWYDWPSDNPESVTIYGNNREYAQQETITGCGSAGGYWRYAMVAYGTGNLKNSSNVTVGKYYAGDQVGFIGIDGNSSSSFDSEWFEGGGMSYIGSKADWDKVKAAFDAAKAAGYVPSNLYWNATSASPISWFCGEDPTETIYYSATSGSNGSYSVDTGVQKTWTSKTTTKKSVNVGDTVSISFGHNVYASKPNNNISWKVTRTMKKGSSTQNGFSSTNNYVLSASTSGSSGSTDASTSGTSKTGTTASSGRYTGATNYTSGGSSYVLRDAYDITFSAIGTYTFCETMVVNGTSLTQACTVVEVSRPGISGNCGDWVPANYYAGTSSVLSKVVNSNLKGTYKGWQGSLNGTGTTYAKPNDAISWQSCYYPGAQQYANSSIVQLSGVYDGHASHGSSNSRNSTRLFKNLITWTNSYFIETTSPAHFNNLLRTPTNIRYNLTVGNSDIKSVANEYTVQVGDVGETYYTHIDTSTSTPTGASVTNQGQHSWRARCGDSYCTYSHTNDVTVGSYTTGKKESEARVEIPYNFSNSTEFSLDRSTVFAGEKISVKDAKVSVGTRYNGTTEGTYATRVDNARLKLVAYVSTSNSGSAREAGTKNSDLCSLISGDKQCKTVNESGEVDLNANGSLTGSSDTVIDFNAEYNAFDASAGDYMCFVMAVYPATSGSDTNLDPNGNGKWHLSAPRCAKIAKRPSFQIYGGSLYLAGSVNASISTKNNLYGISEYVANGNSTQTVFGSWVEQNTMAVGVVKGLASGAATAGGTTNTNYCNKHVPLSFANYGASNFFFGRTICPVAEATGAAGVATNTVNKQALVDYWATGAVNVGAGATVNLNNASHYGTIASATGVKVRYTHGAGNLSIAAGTIGAGTTHIVRAEGDITINGNLSYPTTARLSSISQIPKLVIYAKNITIGCYVTEVNAILIAEGNVNTCNNNDVNSRARANQLNIRGMVIADSMTLNRTYGAASGTYSSVPAETINYDTSAILWGRYMSGAAESDTLTVTYQHELAPRY